MNRDELMLALQGAGRAHSTATIMFHTAMAAYFGLSATDWKCGDIINQKGPLTAGQLAELTGLTTGAITGLVDRLEKAGIAIRRPDPNDRRRVFIESAPGGEEMVLPLFDSMLEAFSEVTDNYNDDELALILDFMQRSTALMEQEAAKMRAKSADP